MTLSSKLLKPDEDSEAITKLVKGFEAPKIDHLLPQKTRKEIRQSFSQDLTVRDAQFRMSDLVASRLSVEEEEEQRFREQVEKEVTARIAKIEQEAREKAHAEGFESGKKIGFEQEMQRMKGVHEAMIKTAESMNQMTKHVFAEHEEMIIQFLTQVASVVVRQAVATDKDYLVRVLKEIVERSGVKENIKIKLSKTDFSYAQDIQKGLEERIGQELSVKIEADDTLQPSSCVVETSFGEIRSALAQELEAMEKAMMAKVPRPSHVQN